MKARLAQALFVVLLLVVAITAPLALHAQTATSGLRGQVTDPSGATVA